MYNDTIKVANKIITAEDLADIFAKMNEKLVSYKKVYENEQRRNQILEREYQVWTYKENDSILSFSVDFYDDTSIKFDNYNNFISIFNNRLSEIKSIYVRFYLNYDIQNEGFPRKNYSQSINMTIYEGKANIDVSLNSEDKKIDDVYELIKSKVLSAPPKYDTVINLKKWTNQKHN